VEDSSVDEVFRVRTEELQFHYSHEQEMFLLSNVQTGFVAHPASHSMDTGALYGR